eukprot:TRINITY_DN7238_c0_g1_i1.p1 TRINITY_DN7238_c0_g1~~TRINITY_DN7238_c0_g1_i1.p1  ORF type:complete len:464 (-),score=56.45 TRINITY_DN7238_c0_g1_i1:52-1407(-)
MAAIRTVLRFRRKLNSKVAKTHNQKRLYTSATILQTTPSLPSVQQLVKNRIPLTSLQRDFYVQQSIYEQEIKTIWHNSWLFAGWSCQIKNPGDYFVYNIGDESVIIIRGDDYKIRAFENLCRHRGSRVCLKESGAVRSLTCPYHNWVYNKEGKLVKASHMPAEFDPTQNGLYSVSLRELEGVIFINLSNNPEDFDEAARLIGPQIEPHQFNNAKIAYKEDYDIKANWKLVYENNRECYHCPGSHPEYIRTNYDTSFMYAEKDGKISRVLDETSTKAKEIESLMAKKNEEWEKFGFSCSTDSDFPGSGWYRASRTPLREGWVTESIDGKPVAPLMGRFIQRDMGSCRIHTLPNSWIHASSDYACATRLTPVNTNLTKAQVTWVVHKDAVEGKDYDLDKLTEVWKVTSAQDWTLCENNQLGVLSRNYKPGSLSLKKESGVEKFIKWYLKKLTY